MQNLADEVLNQPGLVGVFSTFSVAQPQLFAEIDREKVKAQDVSLSEVHLCCKRISARLTSTTFPFRIATGKSTSRPIRAIGCVSKISKNSKSATRKATRVPLATMLTVKPTSGPPIVNHYNLYPSAELNGVTAPGVSSGQAIAIMDDLATNSLPTTMGYEWTELTYQQILASKDILTKLAFPLGVVFVFLVLSAQYESWSLPLSIILIVPMCILAALTGVWLAQLDNNVWLKSIPRKPLRFPSHRRRWTIHQAPGASFQSMIASVKLDETAVKRLSRAIASSARCLSPERASARTSDATS